MKLLVIALIILAVIGAAVGVYFFFPSPLKPNKPAVVKTFEDCQDAGFLVVDTIPRECHTKSDQVFVEIYNGALVKEVVTAKAPEANQLVTSPFKLEGEAVGGWYYNDVLNVRLVDDSGKILMTKDVKALGSTKTTSFVPFTAAIGYKEANVSTEKGKLIIEHTNPAFKGQITPLIIPVRFK